MRLIWIRHGETDANRDGRYCGHWDVPLNERGRRQAEQAAKEIRRFPVSSVYASDLLRCVETAEFLCPFVEGGRLQTTPSLRELSFGVWEGLTYEEIRKRDPDRLARWMGDPRIVAPPEGETLHQLSDRLLRWVNALKDRHPGETVAVVSHGGPIRWFFADQVHRDLSRFWSIRILHGGWAVAEWDGKQWKEGEKRRP